MYRVFKNGSRVNIFKKLFYFSLKIFSLFFANIKKIFIPLKQINVIFYVFLLSQQKMSFSKVKKTLYLPLSISFSFSLSFPLSLFLFVELALAVLIKYLHFEIFILAYYFTSSLVKKELILLFIPYKY